MRRRFSSHAALIEMTIALLFLMLAMVTILGLFTTAYSMSREAKQMSQAIQAAQDCAALVQAYGYDKAMMEEAGYLRSKSGIWIRMTESGLRIEMVFRHKPTEVGNVTEADIFLYDDERLLHTQRVARYEGDVIQP